MNKIAFGATAKDKITGFVGIVTGHADYITGCDQYLLSSQAKDGQESKQVWFDEQRIVVDPEINPIVIDNSAGLGADLAAPMK